MFRFFLFLILIVLGIGTAIWFSVQSVPSWFEADQNRTTSLSQRLSEKIEQQGIGQFLGGKFADVMRGELTLSEDEFNALVLASLKRHRDGKRLLSVSDAVHVELNNDRIELGVVVNFAKMAKADAKARKVFDKAMELVPFKSDQRIYIAVQGTPQARQGGISFKPDFSVRLGALPIPNAVLQGLGVPVEKASEEVLPIRYLSVKSINTLEGEIVLGVRPRF